MYFPFQNGKSRPINNTDTGSTDSSGSGKQLWDGGADTEYNGYPAPKTQPNVGLFQVRFDKYSFKL